jgi:putative acetyltransferase
MWRARLTETLAPGKQDLILVAELHGEVVGNAGLHPIGMQLRRRHALHLGMAVAPHAQGQGVGSALMQAMCDYADHWAQALRIELSVFADNERAIALYRKFGFVHEGTHRAYAMRHGQYVDVHSMARLHPNPPRLPSREAME